MSILFGPKHHVRKAILPSELNVSVSADIKLFELHQHYTHFFFLPVSSYKSIWLARTVDNRLLETGEELKEELAKQYKTDAPWLPFAGTILFLTVLVVLLGWMVYRDQLERRHRRQVQQWALDETLERERYKREHRINEPSLEDYYLFKVNSPGIQRGFVRAKVIGNKDSAVLLQLARLVNYDTIYNPTKIVALFEDSVLTRKPVWISKALLIKMMESPQVPDCDTAQLGISSLELEKIQLVHNRPDFEVLRNYNDGKFTHMILNNVGIDFWITAMDAVKGGVMPDRPLPDDSPVLYGRSYYFSVRYRTWDNDTVRFRMDCVDKKKQVFQYQVTITDHETNVKIKPLSD